MESSNAHLSFIELRLLAMLKPLSLDLPRASPSTPRFSKSGYSGVGPVQNSPSSYICLTNVSPINCEIEALLLA